MSFNHQLKYISPIITSKSTGRYKAPKWAYLALFLSILTFSLPSCKVKEGCPVKDYTNTMEKSNKRGKSNLFDKSMRKKMKK